MTIFICDNETKRFEQAIELNHIQRLDEDNTLYVVDTLNFDYVLKFKNSEEFTKVIRELKNEGSTFAFCKVEPFQTMANDDLNIEDRERNFWEDIEDFEIER